MIAVLPEGREGEEDEVHEAVEVGHVNCEDLNYDLSAQELEGPRDGAFHCVGETTFWVFIFSMERCVAGFFALVLSFHMEKFGRTAGG